MLRILRNIFFIALLFAAAGWLLRRTGAIPEWRNPFAAKPVVIDNTPLLVQNIKSIAQLMTIEYFDEVVVDSTRSTVRMLPLPPFVFPEKAVLVLIVKGRLLAGLDLRQLNKSSFSGNTDSVVIELPRAKILEAIVNPTDVETFSERGTWNGNAVAALKQKAIAQMLRNAAAQGVLQRANEKARNLVQQLMLNAGYKKVSVTTRQ